MTIKISQLANLTVVQANTVVPVVSNITGTLTTVQANVQQLQDYIVANGVSANITALYANAATQSDLIIGINANVTAANVGIIGYVGLANTIQSAQITSANLGIIGYVDNKVSTANIGVIGYIDLGNTTTRNYIDGQISAANAGVTTANIGIIGYINLGNTSMKSYVDGQITAANAGVTSANIGMKGYVDNQTYSNVQNLAFFITNVPTYQGNIGVNVNVTNGTVTANSFVGDGSQLSNLPATSYGNAQVQTYLTTNNYLTDTTANLSNYAYNANITAANLGMKGYVDSVASQSIYGNSNVLSYLTGGFDGNIIPSANVTYSLGSSTNQWKDLWVSGNTIHIGGVALSVSGNTLVVNGQAQSALYDLTTSNVFLGDLPGGYGNVTLNNDTRQIVFERSSFGASDFTQFKYTVDGTDPATSGTAISLFLPELATQRINVAGNLTLKTTFVGGSPGSNAQWYIYQYR
jgi:hypothetical protein